MKIQDDKFYSLLEAQKLTGIKSRQYLAKYVTEGKLLALKTGGNGTRLRYAIKGEWLKSFLDRYKRGVIDNERYCKGEMKLYINRVIEFCEQNKITNLSELKQYEKNHKAN